MRENQLMEKKVWMTVKKLLAAFESVLTPHDCLEIFCIFQGRILEVDYPQKE